MSSILFLLALDLGVFHRVEVRGTDHYEFLDGKVIREDSYWKIVEK